MSGRLIELGSGKIPQRALRYLDRLPYAGCGLRRHVQHVYLDDAG
jgi:hypothetical protein